MERDRVAITIYPKSEEDRELINLWRLWFKIQSIYGKKMTQADWVLEKIREWAKENPEQIETLKRIKQLGQ